MPTLCDQEKCTGCMACMNICPHNAIMLDKSNLDQEMPVIDNSKCVDCRLCENTCPVLNDRGIVNNSLSAYAVYSDDEYDKRTCASGGLISVLSREVINRNGVVFGVCFSSSGVLLYTYANTLKDLEKFKGSKYVYSSPNYIYRHVKNFLKEGKEVLFVGLPCHIDGLKHYLNGNNYEKLITIDLICHGVSSCNYFISHLTFLGFKSVDKISFRSIDDYILSIEGNNHNKHYQKKYNEDLYFYSLMTSISTRDSCVNCRYVNMNRVSDITAGDFWGLSKSALNGYNGKVSLAIINTNKGASFFEKNTHNLIIEKRSLQEAIDGNKRLQSLSEISRDRIKFRKIYLSSHDFIFSLKHTSISRKILINKFKKQVKKIIKR